MLYFKDFVYDNKGNRKYEIADCETQQREIYTYEQIHQLLEKIGYTSIYGVVYSGSKFIFRKSTPAIMLIDLAPKGSTFRLIVDNKVKTYTKVGDVLSSLGWYWRALQSIDGESGKLTRDYLLDHPDAIVQFI